MSLLQTQNKTVLIYSVWSMQWSYNL